MLNRNPNRFRREYYYVNLLVSFGKEQAHGGALNDLISEHVSSSCAWSYNFPMFLMNL